MEFVTKLVHKWENISDVIFFDDIKIVDFIRVNVIQSVLLVEILWKISILTIVITLFK